jgi:glycosyltransferase involved in cell wall biosynthesis
MTQKITNALSVCLISKNEAHAIARALTSIRREFGSIDIIVVDAESIDATTNIAKHMDARVFTKPWTGFAEARNFALAQATTEWVLFVDCDEAIEEGFAAKWTALNATNKNLPNCFSVRRREFFLGRELYFGPGNPSHQWRLFRRSAVRFVGAVHEYPEFDGPIGSIESTGLLHWVQPDEPTAPENVFQDVVRFLNKMNHYTTLEALERFAQGQTTTLWHAFFTFFSTILKNGISYQGFRNGKEGVVLILLEAFSRTVRHLKLWVLWRKLPPQQVKTCQADWSALNKPTVLRI